VVSNLKEIREKNKLTQEELATMVKVSRQTIISIEKEYYVPTTPLALKLAEVLKTKVEDIFILEKKDWK
jgi:putative transcriptional regulator